MLSPRLTPRERLITEENAEKYKKDLDVLHIEIMNRVKVSV